MFNKKKAIADNNAIASSLIRQPSAFRGALYINNLWDFFANIILDKNF
jgi:hypothetical protein